MQAPLEDLVGVLYGRFRQESDDHVTAAAHLFAIASDLVHSLTEEEQNQQLQRVCLVLEQSVCAAGNSGTADVRGAGHSCTPTLLLTSSALLVSCGTSVAGGGGSSTTDALTRWESALLRLFSAHPPFPDEVVSSASYGAARLLLQGRANQLLEAACDALRTGKEGRLTVGAAMEVLAQTTSLLSSYRPVELHGVTLVDPVTARHAASKGRKNEGNKGKGGGDPQSSGPAARGRARVAAERAVDAPSSPATMGTAKASRAAHTELTLNEDVVRSLQARLVLCCLDALGTAVSHRDDVVPALLCRRLLIPLLLMDRDKGSEDALAVYDAQVHALLRSLAAEVEKRDEVVVLMAALFDYLFPSGFGAEGVGDSAAVDFRRDPLLWGVLRDAMWEALTADTDAGRRASMELRAAYLLKRVVYLTEEEDLALPTAELTESRRYHPFFVWTPGKSATSWEMFFLVLEALNEYGLHIAQPALVKLDALLAELEHALTDAHGDHRESAALHPVWVEVLLLKLVRHPNLGVRRVGLRRVWALPLCVLQQLSADFLFEYVFVSSSDSRLCMELDRAPISANFLDTRAHNGREVSMTPHLEPVAQEVERFYTRLFLMMLRGADARTDALRRILRVVDRPSRFMVCVLLRTLHHLGAAVLEEGRHSAEAKEWSVAMLLDSDVLDALGVVLRDVMQENVPFWLDVRFTVILFAALLSFVALDPPTFRGNAAFWKLFCMCGPLGQSGGKSIARMDACGYYGLAGASVDQRFLQVKLRSVSAAMPPYPGGESLLHRLLQPSSLLTRTEALLQSSTFDEAAVKQLFFLTGALTRDAVAPAAPSPTNTDAEDHAAVRAVCELVGQTVASYANRAYSATEPFLTAVAAFVELHHTLGSTTAASFFTMSRLQEMSAAVHAKAWQALEAGQQALPQVHAVNDLVGPDWALVHTESFDVLAAAVVSINQLALQHSTSAAAGQLQSKQTVQRLIKLAQTYAQEFAAHHTTAVASRAGATTESEVAMARQYAQIILARDVTRLLQSELCGLMYAEGPGPLPTCAEAAQVDCFLGLTPSEAASSIDALTQCLTQRLTVSSGPCPLSSQSWPTLLAQHARSVYNAILILCQCLRPDAGGRQPPQQQQQQQLVETVELLQSFGIQHVEQCWISNLATVFDILAWVASTQLPCVNYTAVLDAIWQHVNDVKARQHTRLCLLAYTTLGYALPFCPAYVQRLLRQSLDNEQETERNVYLVAVTASMQVLRNPKENWPLLRDALLHVTVFYNSGRDEEENECTMVATEPLLRSWPEELRMLYPPTVRMATIGRALALSTILWCASQDATLAAQLTQELLELNVTHPIITHLPCMPNSQTHRTRFRLWQLICALQPLVPNDLATAQPLFEYLLFQCVPLTNPSSVRQFMELYAIRWMERLPALYHTLASALHNYNLRPQVCGTYMPMVCHALLREENGDAPEEEGLFDALFPCLLQQSTSHQHLLRIIADIGLYEVCRAREANGKTLSRDARAIYEYIAEAGEHIKFREKYGEQIYQNTAQSASPRALFCVQRREANTILREGVPAAAFERIRFLETEMSCLTGALFPAEWLRARRLATALEVQRLLSVFEAFPHIPHTTHRADYFVDYAAEAAELLLEDTAAITAEEQGSADASDNVQKKVTSWWNSEVYNELHPRALRSERQSLVVVGSLLENPVNIAGLCRCGEIFTVERVVVPNKEVFVHPHFVAAARSAELWIPWDEVLPKDLPGYLEAMRREGYTIVGIEQTASSVSMATYEFPKRTVMVLGAEGQGIPAPLIPLLDVCVEIPQYGLIRSLNVHVTGAIVMYEYTRQHRMAVAALTSSASGSVAGE